MSIPNKIFIIPYRNRDTHKKIFIKKMTHYLRNEENWELYFSHQCDERPFNRGATKNIGFLAIKNKYPNHYKDITFIFHDVDTYPSEDGLINYNTTDGVVKHFYGFDFALGGMFAIKGKDFEKTLGFPNFWGWGFEDNTIYDRCIKNNIKVDRSNFFPVNDKRIIREDDGIYRLLSKGDVSVYKYEEFDNYNDIKNLNYNIQDNMINITSFDCKLRVEDQDFYLRNQKKSGQQIRVTPGYRRKNWSMSKIMNK